ncbi:ORF1297 [White spot syndrome virus]|uniref:Wsv510 n=3 Tax=White spot syndrome virus TaxID=342409 RepID=Q8VAB6_WSSVS|nr:wsv510 [Shrimp white spot syndrome virus]AFX59872.1 wsv510 [White spot syndrome virus]AAL33511.1 wsv510 [Shrimp white spot syndrome virus]ATU83799.1 ORF1297 [White spot syndrome virus]AWQ60607.1 wsv510 [Shrimp white spot syndrome virus]AWQ61044.1 wsv510 [Shrimp white spot syndrome virus]
MLPQKNKGFLFEMCIKSPQLHHPDMTAVPVWSLPFLTEISPCCAEPMEMVPFTLPQKKESDTSLRTTTERGTWMNVGPDWSCP